MWNLGRKLIRIQFALFQEWNLGLSNLVTSVQYAISQLGIVRSGLHLVTYLNVGNFCDKRTEKTLHEICVHGFLKFSDSNKPSQSVSLIYELAWLARIGKSEENLFKTSCKAAPVTKVAHIFWWHHINQINRQMRVNIDATLDAIFRIIRAFAVYTKGH